MHVAVIGGGLSGTTLVHHLLVTLDPSSKIFWFERHPPFARGIAYGTTSDAHVLNVAAQNMSAFADAPHDLLDWLGAAKTTDFTDAFVPRRTYARYLEERCLSLRDHGGRLRRIDKEVVDLRPMPSAVGEAFELVAIDGARVVADAVALTVGHFAPMAPRVAGLVKLSSANYIAEPWNTAALDAIDSRATVACLGAGLSMVDVVLHLMARRFEGQVVAVSRQGQWPHSHSTRPSAIDLAVPPRATGSPTALLRWLRECIAAHVERGGDWRQIIDGLRPHTASLWRRFGEAGQARFLRHGKSLWDAHRHRVAPHVGKTLATLRREGRLSHHAGRLERAEPIDGADGRARVALHWRLRRAGSVWRQEADVLINCTGAHNVWPRAADRLPRALLSSGLVTPGPHHLGLAMREDGRLSRADGEPHERLWSMGPSRVGIDFESVAVPELREQAARLAHTMTVALRPTHA